MAEFGANVTEAPQTPSFSQPRKGIVEEPTAIKGLTNIFEGFREARQAGRERDANAFISSFTNQQLSEIQSVEQGKTSSRFARTRMRSRVIQAINDYPQLRKEILQANSSIIGNAGMGSIVTEGTQAEIREENIRNKVVQEGFVGPDATEEEFEAATSNWQLAQEAQRRYQQRMDTINLEKAKEGLTQQRIDTLNTKQKAAAEDFITDSAPAMMDKFKKRSKDILGSIAKGEIKSGDAVALIDSEFNQFEQEMANALSNVSSHQAEALMKGYRQFKDIVIKRAKGEYTLEGYQNEVKKITARQEALAVQNNSVLAKAAALSNLGINEMLVPGNLDIGLSAAKFLGDNADEEEEQPANVFTNTDVGRKGLREYLDTISEDYEDPAQLEEQAMHIRKIFDASSTYEGVISNDPSKAIELTNWMASQEFYNLRQKHPEEFQNTDTAMRILQANYGDEVWGMVRNQFRENNVYITPGGNKGIVSPSDLLEGEDGEMIATDSLVSYRPTSSGVEFIPLKPDMRESVGEANKLNRELAPIINNTIKAFAHLEGSNDYKSYFEKAEGQIMQLTGGDGEDELAGGDAGDDLTLQSFNTPQSSLNEAMTKGGYVGDGDWQNATTPQEVAASFTGFEENEHKNVLSEFIKKAGGINIDPSTTAWCAAFINAALGAKDVEGTGKLNARSFLDWGTPIKQPTEGDVAVFERGNSGWQGHVGFYVGPGKDRKHIRILGGNQSNKVSIKEMPISKLLGYRRAS